MNHSAERPVAVVIAAYNAEKTIGRAVASALRQREAAEVIVADDASTDGTREAAAAADDGSGRLKILPLEKNQGPSAARTRAIEASGAPVLAVLDSDDQFLPGRLARLLGENDWDFIADNICFVEPGDEENFDPSTMPNFPSGARSLDLADFVMSNISQRGRPRAELGFLKPLIRRDFLDAHGLRYNAAMRFGEDYDLYLRALAAGARFKLTGACGYLAVERATSLSGTHSTDDLRRLAEADAAVLATARLAPPERRAVLAHRHHVLQKYHLRRFLDRKREDGLLPAVGELVAAPDRLPGVVSGVAQDKLDFLRLPRSKKRHREEAGGGRFLLDPQFL